MTSVFSKLIQFCSVFATIVTIVFSAPRFTFNDGMSTLEIMQSYQFWGVYTRPIDNVPKTDSRADLLLKQGRFGFKGFANPALSYFMLIAYDNAGRDIFTGTQGTAQPTTNSLFQLFDAYCTWKLDSTFANITFGYFRVQNGNESINIDAGLTSMDKALTSSYLRQFQLGRGNGRETGINIGGFLKNIISIGYNVGMYDPNHTVITGSDGGGRNWNPLLMGRFTFSVGMPDMELYTLHPSINFYGDRNGLTIGGHVSYQGTTNENWDTVSVKFDPINKKFSGSPKYIGGFKNNQSAGIDFIANYHSLNIDGELDFMRRSLNGISLHNDSVSINKTTYTDYTFHIRTSYIFEIYKSYYLEPALLYSRFRGSENSPVYTNGEERIIDGGVNLYLNKNKLKISLHGVLQDGKAKSLFQSSPTDLKGNRTARGDYAVLGVQLGI